MLNDIKSEDEYLQAVRAGKDKYLLEVKERFKHHTKSAPSHSKDKGMSRER